VRFDQAEQVFPRARPEFLLPVLIEMPSYGIDEPNEQASFLAQMGQETQGFTKFEENLNYSGARLVAVWPRRFYLGDPIEGRRNAADYAGRPQRLAEFVYGGRMGNGPEGDGDGWNYRGRGVPMLTGRSNYIAMALELGFALVTTPELMLEPEISAKVACHFWRSRGFDRVDDDADVRAETRLLNGGEHGLAQRQAYFDALMKAQGEG
jgi:putative chitinase